MLGAPRFNELIEACRGAASATDLRRLVALCNREFSHGHVDHGLSAPALPSAAGVKVPAGIDRGNAVYEPVFARPTPGARRLR